MTLAQYFEYHASLKPKWKDKYVSFKELKEQINLINRQINRMSYDDDDNVFTHNIFKNVAMLTMMHC
jgi:hypothetical protein